jgi:hypothetical protein
MKIRTNEDRSEAARIALGSYMAANGLTAEDGWETIIGDFMTDLHHLADTVGVSWERLHELHDMHYGAEISGDE